MLELEKSHFSGYGRRISIQQMLQANEITLGHYSRFSEVIKSLDHPLDNELTIEVFVPWLEDEAGVKRVPLKINQSQRVLSLVLLLATHIGLKYYKDFRLFLEREYANRQLDDD